MFARSNNDQQPVERFQDCTFNDLLIPWLNPDSFRRRLRQVIQRSKRYKGYRFAVLLVGLERFKVIQFSMGRPVGAKLLKAFDTRLTYALNSTINYTINYTVARWSEDELAVLLEDINDISEASLVAEQICASLRTPFSIDDHDIFLSANIGIASNDRDDYQASALLDNASLALYRAKMESNTGYQLFTPAMRTRSVERLQLEDSLRLGIKRQELRLYYQPIVSLETHKLAGFEALVRWEHPERGLLLPAEFIPVAEETKLIVPLGWWVLQEACQQMWQWQQQFPHYRDLTISVNISSLQLSQPDLIGKIDTILWDSGLDAQSLKLEITESILLETTTVVLLEKLKQRQIQLCIDDFGTGYSGFSYLPNFPIDILKIDRSFVKGMSDNHKHEKILRWMVKLANDFGIHVVAEGVETEKQLGQLCDWRCQYGQGYWFSKPLNAQATEAWLEALSVGRWGDGEMGIGNRESGIGNRESGIGNRELRIKED
ncbi:MULTISPECIES: bifunctional diguanylate cyclase/phosphodiesterase [unclassified Moorena]|uniref:putative bifunctional diguanylate cyclase/phosphodiesterase n=1 Tax=unclassified Moorena TaxID=2683338 RepID=UPI0013FFE22D|nr:MULTISPECIES: bifunctional diguanylate cyclase/phosphodiesterase [unclassified Moorena]NEO16486.1 bifunctional diguanylate cyclase/phosphodiesterase [Moorena sp. SIO3E8]NEQ03014.1 bifunctional diguanylate cyclase/phosphodiesterase [Moorena sp. SIO3F7]